MREFGRWCLDVRYKDPLLSEPFICLRGVYEEHQDWWTSPIQTIEQFADYADVSTKNHTYRIFYALHDASAGDEELLQKTELSQKVTTIPKTVENVRITFDNTDGLKIKDIEGLSAMVNCCDGVVGFEADGLRVIDFKIFKELLVLADAHVMRLEIENGGIKDMCFVLSDGVYIVPPGKFAVRGECEYRVYAWD